MNINHHIAEDLLRVRLGQLIINEEIKKNAFNVPIHLALGHEAIAVAVSAIMSPGDQLALTHRNIHYNLARSPSLKSEIDEYLLKQEGLGGGTLGSMNLANSARGITYTSSILGNDLCVAGGMAMAQKVKKNSNLVIAVTGDGAMEEGAFYEALTFMRSFDLCTIVIVENNGWSLATQIHERRCAIRLDRLADATDTGYVLFEGNDPYQYADKLNQVKSEVLDKKRPVIVEVKLQTLGDWRLKTDEYPDGKFINYHAGPAPTVAYHDWPLLFLNRNDPVFVLLDYFEEDRLKKMAKTVATHLIEEIQ